MKRVSERTHKRKVQKETDKVLEYIGTGVNNPCVSVSETVDVRVLVSRTNITQILSESQSSTQPQVNEFISVGGSTCQDAIDRMLKKFMTDETVSKFSWKGRSGKSNFSSLRVNSCIFDSLRRNPKTKGAATEEVSQSETQKYIHRVNDRMAKRLKENQNNQPENTSDDESH